MISIVIPCFNEEEVIVDGIKKVQQWMLKNKCEGEILVVNNKSTDSTVEKIHNLVDQQYVLLLDEYIKGKGAAVKKGLQNCKFDKVLILDADLSTDINEFNPDWLSKKNYHLLIGSRSLGKEINTPIKRVLAGKVFNFIVRKMFKIDIKDTQCGFKYLHSDKIQKISERLTFSGFSFDVDLIEACKEIGLEIQEVPIKYIFNKNSSVSLIIDSIIMLRDLVKIRRKYKNDYFPR